MRKHVCAKQNYGSLFKAQRAKPLKISFQRRRESPLHKGGVRLPLLLESVGCQASSPDGQTKGLRHINYLLHGRLIAGFQLNEINPGGIVVRSP